MRFAPRGRGGKSAARPRPSFVRAALLALSAALSAAGTPALTIPPEAPPLPSPSGTVVSVSTVGQLQNAVAALASNSTVLIAPGTYALTQTLRIRGGISNVALRGATGNRSDVVIRGGGMATHGVDFGISVEDATDVLVANLSLGEFFYHAIQLHGEQGCERVRLYNVRLFDAGEQFVKGSVDFGAPDGVDGGIVEYCVIEYTAIGPAHGYTNGVDIHTGAGWVIRRNLFRNIRVPLSAPQSLGPAVLMWSGSSGTIVEENVFVDCERAIAFGLGPQAGFAHGHSGGRIANNFIARGAGVRGDSAISVWDSPDTQVFHNTVLQNGSYPTSIEYRFAGTTGVAVRNNLTDGTIIARDGAQAQVSGNFSGATAALFVAPAAGDLRLQPGASLAIDKGAALSGVATDWEGDPRPWGSARDVGADEHAEFRDVPYSHPFHHWIKTLLRGRITSGCGGGNFCPDASMTRDQMAVLLLRAEHGGGYAPPAATGSVFADVASSSPYAAWIERLYAEGITGGCAAAPLSYCPDTIVSRSQMSKLLLRARDGGSYQPPGATGLFGDVPLVDPFADWIEELSRRGITSGCGGGNFCPDDPNTRGQMAVFLGKTFGLR